MRGTSRIVALFVGLAALALPVNALQVANSTVFSRPCWLITWKDHLGKDRTASLVNSGDHLAIVQQFTYYNGASLVTVVPGTPDSDPLNSGFGSSTHHGSSCHYCGGTITQRYQGASMAIFDWHQVVDGSLETITYTFMDGHDYFQWAQTDDDRNATGSGDSRGPYCTMNWNATGNTAQGVAFGATKYFYQASYNGPWTFKDTCDIPYNNEWGDGLEIGYIQTQTRRQQLAGAPLLSEQLPASYSTVTDSQATLMDFQMCFYDKWVKITWGMPYGFMEKSTGAVGVQMGQKLGTGGYWGQYSLSIVLDSKTAGGVMRVMKENRALQNKTFKIAANPGTLQTQGPVGTVNPNLQALAPAGWDHNTRAFWVVTKNASAAITFTITSDTVSWVNPTFKLDSMTAVPTKVVYNSAPLTAGTDYYTSVDAANQEVWLTLNKTISGATNTLLIGDNTSAGVGRPLMDFAAADRGALLPGTTVSLYNARGALVAQKITGALGGIVHLTPALARGLFGNLAKGTYFLRAPINGIDRQVVAVY